MDARNCFDLLFLRFFRSVRPHRDSHVVRFGVYEADLRAGELRKRGFRIRLPEQPFQLLAILLEHAGEVVTREDLQKRHSRKCAPTATEKLSLSRHRSPRVSLIRLFRFDQFIKF